MQPLIEVVPHLHWDAEGHFYKCGSAAPPPLSANSELTPKTGFAAAPRAAPFPSPPCVY